MRFGRCSRSATSFALGSHYSGPAAGAFDLSDQALAQRDRINLAVARGGLGRAEASKSDPFLSSILYRQAFGGTTVNANEAVRQEPRDDCGHYGTGQGDPGPAV